MTFVKKTPPHREKRFLSLKKYSPNISSHFLDAADGQISDLWLLLLSNSSSFMPWCHSPHCYSTIVHCYPMGALGMMIDIYIMCMWESKLKEQAAPLCLLMVAPSFPGSKTPIFPHQPLRDNFSFGVKSRYLANLKRINISLVRCGSCWLKHILGAWAGGLWMRNQYLEPNRHFRPFHPEMWDQWHPRKSC